MLKDYDVVNGCEGLMGSNDSAKVTGEDNIELTVYFWTKTCIS